jgi:hypothetical protein
MQIIQNRLSNMCGTKTESMPRCILNYSFLLGLVALMTILLFFTFHFQFSFSESITTNSSFSNNSIGSIFPIIDGTYTNKILGFHIDLPKGWKGIDLYSMAMASPTGIDAKTGDILPGGDKVMMVFGGGNFSDFFNSTSDHKKSAYLNYLKSKSIAASCHIISDRNVLVKELKSIEIIGQCGLPSKDKIFGYIFASPIKFIFVALKGPGSIVDRNLDTFKASAESIRIPNPLHLNNTFANRPD